jgi:hypothetical protein
MKRMITSNSSSTAFTQRWRLWLTLILFANLFRMIQFQHDYNCSVPLRADVEKEERESNHLSNRQQEDDENRVETEHLVQGPQLNPANEIYFEASKRYQQFLRARQNGNCNNHKIVYDVDIRKNSTAISIYHEIQQISRQMMKVLIQPNFVFHWKGTLLPQQLQQEDCKDYECYFHPLTSCIEDGTSEKPNKAEIVVFHSCPTSPIADILAEKSGIDELGHSGLFDFNFFERETIRFITRPNERLQQTIDQLKENEYKPLEGWVPYRFYGSRIAVSLDTPQPRERLVKGIRIYTYSHAGTGLNQVLARSGTPRVYDEFFNMLSSPYTQSDKDWLKRRETVEKFEKIPVFHLATNTAAKYNPGMLALAEAIIYAECDFFAADFSKNFSNFVAILMRLFRYSNFAPQWDIVGAPFILSFDGNDPTL